MPAVANVDEVRALVNGAGVGLVVERAIRGFDVGAAARAKADAGEPAACADVVAGHSPVGTPMTDHSAVVAQPVLIDVMYVPGVLPLADLEGQRESPFDLRQLDAGGERRISEPKTVVGR